MAPSGTYTIGQVVKRLQPSYPDLTVSKVRYLESEGLVKPRRAKSGYRTYSEADIERLSAVLRLQKSCFYPLSVIREKLEAADSGEAVAELEATGGAGLADYSVAASYPIEELQGLVGVPASFVRSLEEAGLVELSRDERGRSLIAGVDVHLASSAYELSRYGMDPRFLRPYLQQANRELPVFKQVLSSVLGRQGSLEDAHAREAFDARLARMLTLTNDVRDALVSRSLRREFNYPEETTV